MAAAAKLVQLALYALLIAIPATAVLGTWLEGIPVTLPGFDIAPQIAKARGLGQLIMEIHTILGNAILWVAGVHAAAALFHHFYLGDEVFQSMAPGALPKDGEKEAIKGDALQSHSAHGSRPDPHDELADGSNSAAARRTRHPGGPPGLGLVRADRAADHSHKMADSSSVPTPSRAV
jgi:hypothetical protein